jgi:hypothetical protein
MARRMHLNPEQRREVARLLRELKGDLGRARKLLEAYRARRREAA